MKNIHFQGRTLLITRPQPEANSTAQQVRTYHGRPLLAPAMTILPPRDVTPLQTAFQQLHTYHGILLTSANGARAMMAAMKPNQTPPPLFVVGKKTAQIIQKQDWPVYVPPSSAGGEALAHAVMAWKSNKNRFLFPQAEEGREELSMLLRQAGYRVDRVAAYRAEPITNLPPQTERALAEGKVDATLFFSGRTVQAFVAALPSHGQAWLQKTIIAVLSQITAQTVQQLGYTATVISQEPSSEGLLAALHQTFQDMMPFGQ